MSEPTNVFLKATEIPRTFVSDASRLLRKCTKPDAKELKKTAYATGIGFLMMGLIGFAVKLIHIPINNIIIGA